MEADLEEEVVDGSEIDRNLDGAVTVGSHHSGRNWRLVFGKRCA